MYMSDRNYDAIKENNQDERMINCNTLGTTDRVSKEECICSSNEIILLAL